MDLVFANRMPTEKEIEKLRLILSTYQDGTGMLMASNNRTLPGWRDFERASALAFGGIAPENKGIFDVVFPYKSRPGVCFGIDCKMRSTLRQAQKDGRVLMELSNASGGFKNALEKHGSSFEDYRQNPQLAGNAIIASVKEKQEKESIDKGGSFNLKDCFYFALLYKSGWYQLFLFPFQLPESENLKWHAPIIQTKKGKTKEAKNIRADDDTGMVFEFYPTSGGQLKYYPKVESASWKSEPFQLEPLPDNIPNGILDKAAQYFPDLWNQACESKE